MRMKNTDLSHYTISISSMGRVPMRILEIYLRIFRVIIFRLIFSLFTELTMVLKHGLYISFRKSILERIILEQTTESSIMYLEILRCLLLMFVWIWSLEV